jgi:L-ascorbate 6-phosphate lactonase
MQLIQPVQKGETLLNDIHSTDVPHGSVAIWWLGQSGYAIKTASMLFYVDLYLSESLTKKYANTEKPHIRMTEAPIRGGDIKGAKWVFASHKHTDHLDAETLLPLLEASPDATIILPYAIVDHAVKIGIPADRLMPTRGDETFTVGNMTVHSIPSAHPDFDYTDEKGYPFLGFLFDVDGVRMYHSGDTLVYPDLAERLSYFDPHIAFLPVNGTSAELARLHVPPNMSAREAYELAWSVSQDMLMIPHHFEMFTFNTIERGEVERLRDLNWGVNMRLMQCGERTVYSTSRQDHSG